MAVVALTELKGDVKELLGKYDRVNERLMERGTSPAGLQTHACVVLPDGIRIANVWDSAEQARESFKDEFFQKALRDAGFEPQEPVIHEVHRFLNFAAMQGAPT